jgi:predicted exporter
MMKRRCFSLISISRVKLPAVWLAVHAAVFLGLLFSLPVAGPVRINTSLFDILPASRGLREAAAADGILGGKTSRQVTILSSGADFAAARQGAEALYQRLAGSGVFESLSFRFDASAMEEFFRFLYDHRYALLDAETRRLLEEGRAGEIAEDALAGAYGAFSLSPLDYLEGDPFFLTERETNSLLASSLASSGSMTLKDDVLAAKSGDRWYVMLRGTLSGGGVALTNKASAVRNIYAACGDLVKEAESENPGEDGGLRFYYSGVPFHSYESSSNAQREISLISSITLVAVIVLFLLFFRSLLPIACAAAAVLISISLALSSTLLFFREVHVLTFVFGTTLIGTCVDYTIHYFIQWKYNPLLKNGAEIRSHIFRAIFLSFVSSAICFLALLFAPFAILRQFALFSLMGLFSSFLSVNCIFPLIRKKTAGNARGPAGTGAAGIFSEEGFSLPRLFAPRIPGFVKFLVLVPAALVCLLLLFINRGRIKVENNIASLYTMQGPLLESEMISGRVLNLGSAGWYFLVKGAGAEDLLQNEEGLRLALDAEIEKGNLGSYAALSLFIPSEKTQRGNISAARNLLSLADEQYGKLGFPPGAAERFKEDFEEAAGGLVRIGDELPPNIKDIVSNLLIGRAGEYEGAAPGDAGAGAFYSCVLPLHAKDEAVFRLIAGNRENVFFVNKVKDIGAELDRLTRIMLTLFLAAWCVIFLTVRFFYSWKRTLRICAIPFFLVLVSLTVLSGLGIPLSFFPVTGFILVFGLGLDYIFYITESEKKPESGEQSLTALAVFLSFATTALSFGALAMSSFTPVQLFGIAVFSGLSTAYISSILLTRSVVPENQRRRGGGTESRGKAADSS